MIYWPVIAGQARPSDKAIRAIDAFMKQGGTIVFIHATPSSSIQADSRPPRPAR